MIKSTKRIYSTLLVIFFSTISSAMVATPVCTCNHFQDYLAGINEPMYGVNGTEVTAGFNLRNFCPDGNGSDNVVFVWKVDGAVVLTTSGVPVSYATTSLIHDFNFAGSYTLCLEIIYSYTVQSNPPNEVSCSKELCVELEIDGPAYEDCDATTDFNAVVSTNAINLTDYSSTSGSGKIISRKWTIGSVGNSEDYTYYGKNVRHIVSNNYNSGPIFIPVCEEIMVINDVTGECCTDTKCEELMVTPTYESCAMDPDFSFSCFTDDCIYRFNGSLGASTRNAKLWYWDFGDGATSTERSPYHSFATAGQKTVCLTIVGYDEFGNDCCHETYCRTINFTCEGIDLSTYNDCDNTQGPGGPGLEPEKTGMEGINSQFLNAPAKLNSISELTVAPNPAKENAVVNVMFNEAANNVSLKLYNMNGQVQKIYFENMSFEKGNRAIKIDCGGIAKGSYLIQLQTNESITTKTILVE